MSVIATPWMYPAKALLKILPEQVHLWRFSLQVSPETYQTLQTFLSVDELVRADRLLDPEKRRTFIIAKSRLRQLLAIYLDLLPEEIDFSYNQSGKPFLAVKSSSNLVFNLSHSGSRAILAVAIDADLGVDIEKIDFNLNFQSLATRYFTPEEIIKLREASIVRQRRQFYRIWTRKEAVLKMIGSGFSAAEPSGEFLQNCCLKNTFFAGNYVSAIAINRRITSILKFNIFESEHDETHRSPLKAETAGGITIV